MTSGIRRIGVLNSITLDNAEGGLMDDVKTRNPVGVFFLALITLGIYYLYWFYKVNEEAAVIAHDEDANPGLSLLATTVGAILIIPPFWTHWTTAKRVGRATGQPASPVANIIFSVILLLFAGLLYTYWVQGKLNKHVRRERIERRRREEARELAEAQAAAPQLPPSEERS